MSFSHFQQITSVASVHTVFQQAVTSHDAVCSAADLQTSVLHMTPHSSRQPALHVAFVM